MTFGNKTGCLILVQSSRFFDIKGHLISVRFAFFAPTLSCCHTFKINFSYFFLCCCLWCYETSISLTNDAFENGWNWNEALESKWFQQLIIQLRPTKTCYCPSQYDASIRWARLLRSVSLSSPSLRRPSICQDWLPGRKLLWKFTYFSKIKYTWCSEKTQYLFKHSDLFLDLKQNWGSELSRKQNCNTFTVQYFTCASALPFFTQNTPAIVFAQMTINSCQCCFSQPLFALWTSKQKPQSPCQGNISRVV